MVSEYTPELAATCTSAIGQMVSLWGSQSRQPRVLSRTSAVAWRRSVSLWIKTPPGNLALLIFSTLLLRLMVSAFLGLGIDESYMVAAGRHLQLSYFDHPPLAWWMAWLATHLVGTEAPLVVRLPFVLTFALTTWLMFRLTARLFDERAGLWAAGLLNAAPVFGVTTGTWVLPDGPLIAALLAAAICLVEALDQNGKAAWRWWLGAGLCAGVAMLSKYSALLTIAGAAAFLITASSARHWLARPHPYLASLVALAIFSPVIVWNMQHGWISIVFQGGRAIPTHLHFLGPFSTLGGEAIFLLPWIWLPLILCGFFAACRGPQDDRSWLLVCLALPPMMLFTIVALWSHVLFHWASPGYLMLFPLVGKAIERCRYDRRTIRAWLGFSASIVIAGTVCVVSEVQFNWLPAVLENFAPGKDPDLEAVDWTSLRTELAQRGMLAQTGVVIAAIRWTDAGKIDYALGGEIKVICLGPDPREYGLTTDVRDFAGQDVLIVAPRTTLEQVDAQFGADFDFMEPLPPILLRHAMRPAMLVPLSIGHHLHADLNAMGHPFLSTPNVGRDGESQL